MLNPAPRQEKKKKVIHKKLPKSSESISGQENWLDMPLLQAGLGLGLGLGLARMC